MLRFSFLAGRNKEVSKALRDINYAGVLVVYSWCKPGGGTPLYGLYRDVPLDRVWCFISHPVLPWVLTCLKWLPMHRRETINTRQHNAITQRRHVFGNNHDILMNPFYLWFEISSTTSKQRQPWELLDLQEIIKKTFSLKDQCQYNQLLLGRTPFGWFGYVFVLERWTPYKETAKRSKERQRPTLDVRNVSARCPSHRL